MNETKYDSLKHCSQATQKSNKQEHFVENKDDIKSFICKITKNIVIIQKSTLSLSVSRWFVCPFFSSYCQNKMYDLRWWRSHLQFVHTCINKCLLYLFWESFLDCTKCHIYVPLWLNIWMNLTFTQFSFDKYSCKYTFYFISLDVSEFMDCAIGMGLGLYSIAYSFTFSNVYKLTWYSSIHLIKLFQLESHCVQFYGNLLLASCRPIVIFHPFTIADS